MRFSPCDMLGENGTLTETPYITIAPERLNDDKQGCGIKIISFLSLSTTTLPIQKCTKMLESSSSQHVQRSVLSYSRPVQRSVLSYSQLMSYVWFPMWFTVPMKFSKDGSRERRSIGAREELHWVRYIQPLPAVWIISHCIHVHTVYDYICYEQIYHSISSLHLVINVW